MPNTDSIHLAEFSNFLSLYGELTNCKDCGNPFSDKPAGIAMLGNPVKVHGL